MSRTGEGSNPREGIADLFAAPVCRLLIAEVRIDVTTHGLPGQPITLLIVTITYPLPVPPDSHPVLHIPQLVPCICDRLIGPHITPDHFTHNRVCSLP
jgi:hypothetical protein